MFPNKLNKGDEVRVVAPVRSLAIISAESRSIANKRFEEMGLKLTFGKYVEEMDEFASTTIAHRVEDMHEAFSDKKVKAILTVLGGFNSNQLLRYLDWKLIKDNPKIFCGYSDVTALNNSFLTKTGLVTYSGPHYSTFGQEIDFDYTLDYFKKVLFTDEPFEIIPSKQWSDDMWYIDQKKRDLMTNEGWLVINKGEAKGTLIGGNLGTLNLLQGTEYFPSMDKTVLFVEDDEESKPQHFDRDLQSLIHLPDFGGVQGLVIGRFQKASKMDNEKLMKIIVTKQELRNIPVIANVDFGHTDPKITIPIGGEVEIVAGKEAKIKVLRH